VTGSDDCPSYARRGFSEAETAAERNYLDHLAQKHTFISYQSFGNAINFPALETRSEDGAFRHKMMEVLSGFD